WGGRGRVLSGDCALFDVLVSPEGIGSYRCLILDRECGREHSRRSTIGYGSGSCPLVWSRQLEMVADSGGRSSRSGRCSYILPAARSACRKQIPHTGGKRVDHG